MLLDDLQNYMFTSKNIIRYTKHLTDNKKPQAITEQKPQPITKVVEITMDKAYSGCSLPIEITFKPISLNI
jgi:hypothetical protein